jgi:hypothetical protein
MLTIEEYARRLCVANHRADLEPGAQMPKVPCGLHRIEATRTWGYTQPTGRASLLVTIEAAREQPGSTDDFPILHPTAREALIEAVAAPGIEAAEALWAVVANVSEGDWSKQPAEWQEGAIRARELYHAALATATGEEHDPTHGGHEIEAVMGSGG